MASKIDFHSKSTPTGINPDKLEVLGKLLKFEYSNDGYLTDQGIKQLANFIMLEIIKDSKSSFTLFKKSTHQIFTEHVGILGKFKKALDEVNVLTKIYVKEKLTADKRTDPDSLFAYDINSVPKFKKRFV